MTETTTNIYRKDLVMLSILVAPKLRANWVVFIMFLVAAFSFSYFQREPSTPTDLSVLVLVSFFAAFVGLIVAIAFNLGCILLTVDKKSGVLGKHQYKITEEGLIEKTDVNESIQKWNGIISIQKYGGYILIRINSYLYHVIPRRDFKNSESFELFFNEAQIYKNNA